jgi:hypothetical protein
MNAMDDMQSDVQAVLDRLIESGSERARPPVITRTNGTLVQ